MATTADNILLTLDIGSMLSKPNNTDPTKSKMQLTAVYGGTLFIINVPMTLTQKVIKDNKLSIDPSILIKAQSVMLMGKDQNFAVAKYASMKDPLA